jgi:hypothetical protein
MSESTTNNTCSCQALQQMRRDQTLFRHTETGLGWLIAQVNDGTGIGDDAAVPHIAYNTIRFCPFYGGEISWNNW